MKQNTIQQFEWLDTMIDSISKNHITLTHTLIGAEHIYGAKSLSSIGGQIDELT